MDNLHAAMKLTEESGKAFLKLMTREKTYTKLAKYIAASDTELTHADLHEALPFYKSSIGARNEMMTLATAWGYKQHIVIKKSFADGIELFSGETLKETDLEAVRVSYSDHFAYRYHDYNIPFSKLNRLTEEPGMHWANHRFKNGVDVPEGQEGPHRNEENAITGFNLIVLDVDGGVSLDHVHDLLKDYVFMTSTTKRHTETEHRFRLILPIDYELHLDADEYVEFMKNVVDWLPFKVDEQANQRSRKWMSCGHGSYHQNLEGKVLNALPFVPRTSKNKEYQESMKELESLDNLERWFAQRIALGNRNNQMIKFALALADTGLQYNEIEEKVLSFNSRLSNKLSDSEIRNTILVTVAKRLN